VLEKRINEVVQSGSSGCTLYKPKPGVGTINKNTDKFTPEQLQMVKDELEEINYYFGYAKMGDNKLGFFEYDGKAS